MGNVYNRIEKERIRREIERHGRIFKASRVILDQYKERTDEVESYEIRGIYHTQEGYEKGRVSDGTTTTGYGSPMLLVLYDDGEKIEQGDIIEGGGACYKIVRKNNILHLDIVLDLSLEEVIENV